MLKLKLKILDEQFRYPEKIGSLLFVLENDNDCEIKINKLEIISNDIKIVDPKKNIESCGDEFGHDLEIIDQDITFNFRRIYINRLYLKCRWCEIELTIEDHSFDLFEEDLEINLYPTANN